MALISISLAISLTPSFQYEPDLGCVHTDMSTSTSTGPGFCLWPVEA